MPRFRSNLLRGRLVVAACLLFRVPLVEAQDQEIFEQPPFNYSSAAPHDQIAAIQAEFREGKFPEFRTDREALLCLLRRLQIPVESQVLVFSRTSFQRDRINPSHPRALYFNDHAYVGWVPGGLIEVTTIDPVLGPIFYSFDPSAAGASKTFVRESDCLRCHGGTFIRGIPALLARSVYSDTGGNPLLRLGSELVDFRTPFTNRWGGWYVTGQHGQAMHRGNLTLRADTDQAPPIPKQGLNRQNLSGLFDSQPYPAKGSDIVALLVLEQQLTIQNTLTKASLNSRRILDYQKSLLRAFKKPDTGEPQFDSVKSVIDHTAQEVVDDLLFKDEAALPDGLAGDAAFQKAFMSDSIRTAAGKSLKDLDLHGHLFAHRCSYLIYSPSFKVLPLTLKRAIYARLEKALNSENKDPRYSYLGKEESRAIVSILKETVPEIREAWQKAG